MAASKILLVLDDTSSKKLQASLANLDYQIVGSVSEGERAIEKVAELLPDLVIISMQLSGGMSGSQVGSRVYEKYDIPIIYIADQSGEATIRRPGGTAPFGYLFGYLDEKQILATIEVALTRHKMEKDIQRQAMRAEAMLRAAEQLNARLDVKAVLSTVCRICNNTFGTTATSAFMYDPSRNSLISVAIAVANQNDVNDYGFDAQYEIPVDLVATIISESDPVAVIENIQFLDTSGIPYLDKIKEKDVRSLTISGMYQNNALTGILVAQTLGEIRDFTEEELELFRGLTDQASIAIGNATFFEQVVASRERQQALTRRLVDLQEDERRNLARELHDQIGQMMTGLQFSLGSLRTQATDEQKKRIEDAQRQVSSLIAQTREISINLHPSMLDDTGLILTLIWHFDRYTSQTGIKVNFQYYDMLEKRFDAEVEIAVFRIIQEALTNVARYAKTDSVDVVLTLEEQLIKIEISDQGQGFDLSGVDNLTHMGLNSMRERAYAVGGVFQIHTAPGKGTRIHALIPLSGTIERRQHERHHSSR